MTTVSSHQFIARLRRMLGTVPASIRYPALTFLAVRFLLSALVAVISLLFPSPPLPNSGYLSVEPVHQGIEGLFLGVWQRWDAIWYQYIAEYGYGIDDGTLAFPPLFPMIIRIVAKVGLGGHYLMAGLLVSNVAFFLALIAAYRFVESEWNGLLAQRTVLYLAIFPTSFFFFVGYTESLFLLCSIITLYQARKAHWLPAGLFAALATITRFSGILLVIPLVCEYLRRWRFKMRIEPQHLLALVLAPLALAAYSLWLCSWTGDPLIWIHAHNQPPWLHTFSWPWNTLARGLWYTQSVNNIIDLCFALAFIPLLIAGFRVLPLSLSLYAALMYGSFLFSPKSGAPLYAMPRLVLALFPSFVVMAMATAKPALRRATIVLFSSLLFLFAFLFTRWCWIA